MVLSSLTVFPLSSKIFLRINTMLLRHAEGAPNQPLVKLFFSPQVSSNCGYSCNILLQRYSCKGTDHYLRGNPAIQKYFFTQLEMNYQASYGSFANLNLLLTYASNHLKCFARFLLKVHSLRTMSSIKCMNCSSKKKRSSSAYHTFTK